MANKPTYEEDGWVDYLLDRKILLQQPDPGVRAGSLWTSRSTGRRGLIRWVSRSRCCLVFNDGQGRHEMTLDDLRRLYTPV